MESPLDELAFEISCLRKAVKQEVSFHINIRNRHMSRLSRRATQTNTLAIHGRANPFRSAIVADTGELISERSLSCWSRC